MLSVTIKVQGIEDAIRKLNQMRDGLGNQAARSAVNKMADQAKTKMSAMIRQDYNISASLLRERLIVRKSFRADGANISAALVGNPHSSGGKRSMNLIHFLERSVTLAESRRRARGGTLSELRFKVRRTGGKQMLRGAFIGNNGRTVFIREGKARLPIKPVQTIGVPQMFSTKKNIREIQAFIHANLPRLMQSEIRHYLRTIR